MHIAINICDMMTFIKPGDVFSWLQLLLGPVMTRDVVECERRRIDGAALLVKHDVGPERWQAIYQIIRKGIGNREPIHKNKLRIYESRTGKGSWNRI